MHSEQLAVMDAVVRNGSFNAAAKVLNRVQSAVSYSIKTLEEELGLVLFSRESYRPQLTPVGEAIYRKAKMVLAELDEIRALAQQLRQGREPVVRLDFSPLCPMAGVLGVLKRLGAEFPQTQVRISMEVFGGEALVLNNEADLSLTDQVNDHPQLASIPWRVIPMLAAVAPEHLLARQGCRPSRAEIVKHFQIVVGSQSRHTAAVSLGVMQDNLTWRVNDFATKHRLLLDGVGWGHLPREMIAGDLDEGRLVALDLPYMAKQNVRLNLVRKRSAPHGPVAERLWALLCELIAQPGGMR